MSCTTEGCPSGKRCFQTGFEDGLAINKCINSTTPRGGKVLEPSQTFAKATGTLDSMIQMALGGGKRTIIPKNKDFKSKLELIEDYQGGKKKNKRGGEQKDEEEEETTNTPAAATTTPPSPPVATTTTGGGPAKALEWIKANPPFAIIIAGLLLYIIMKGGR